MEEIPKSFSSLPHDPNIEIASYLSYPDLIALCSSTDFFQDLCERYSFWNRKLLQENLEEVVGWCQKGYIKLVEAYIRLGYRNKIDEGIFEAVKYDHFNIYLALYPHVDVDILNELSTSAARFSNEKVIRHLIKSRILDLETEKDLFFIAFFHDDVNTLELLYDKITERETHWVQNEFPNLCQNENVNSIKFIIEKLREEADFGERNYYEIEEVIESCRRKMDADVIGYIFD